MSILLTVFSLGDYTADQAGLELAVEDGATEALSTDIANFGICVQNAFTVARKLGHEICVHLEHHGDNHFYTKDDFVTPLPFPMSAADNNRISGRLREIKRLVGMIDDLHMIDGFDVAPMTRQVNAMLEAWIQDAQALPIRDDGCDIRDAKYLIMIGESWLCTQKGFGDERQPSSLLWEITEPSEQRDSGLARLGNWAEMIDGEPVINITLNDLREVLPQHLPR